MDGSRSSDFWTNASVEIRDFDLLRAPRRRILRGKSRGRGGGFLTSAGLVGGQRGTRSTVAILLVLSLLSDRQDDRGGC
jgi:hypothetical protein